MTLFFYVAIALITFVAFLHAWSKKDYDVSRTIVINRPKSDVYAFTRRLKNQTLWNSWYLKANSPQIKFKEADGKLGAISYWKGNDRIGEGTQKITKIKPGKVLETKILLVKPTNAIALAYFATKEIQPERTKMVFGVRGYLSFPFTVISIFYSMENRLGKEFEESLQNLKRELEK
ncbi:SRPBCC family protein [Zunongwangia endophytica]|uniref:SRPBCC family protein n=1 Tax=Zunongwangia endophytica TaxID=1808945 RepID=A0ABV8HF84_9FLAO|nr:SRPBCC family protein [Zunongwangia endophytica]MDN3593920.1 SRPBCC family protein [Zunongwangia endophytica]